MGKVLYSKEEPIKNKFNSKTDNELYDALDDYKLTRNKVVPGSISFVPSVAGLMIAGEVIKDIVIV